MLGKFVCLAVFVAVATAQQEEASAPSNATEIPSFPPTVDDKPWDERAFGDSTKIPLKPVFDSHTVKFIDNVLNAEVQPPPLTAASEAAAKAPIVPREVVIAPPPIPRTYSAEEMWKMFSTADNLKTGQLELAQANPVFETLQIRFTSIDEMMEMFPNNYMSFALFCDMMATRGLASAEDAAVAKMKWVSQELQLPTSVLSDPNFPAIHRAINWLSAWRAEDTRTLLEPFPQPPSSLFKTPELVEVAKNAIVAHEKIVTARTDEMTYENAHLSKPEYQQVVNKEKSQTVAACHPALMEECEMGTACCQGSCCPSESGKTFCSDSC